MDVITFASTYWNIITAFVAIILAFGSLWNYTRANRVYNKETRRLLHEHMEDDMKRHDALEVRLQLKDTVMSEMKNEQIRTTVVLENFTASLKRMEGKVDKLIERP